MSTELQVDAGMYDKGYRYRLTPDDNAFAPLYSKTLDDIGPMMRDYPDTSFTVAKLDPLNWASADDLNELLVHYGKNWAEVTETDPDRCDRPSPVEMEIVRQELRRLQAIEASGLS
jgi:hypothetical protein